MGQARERFCGREQERLLRCTMGWPQSLLLCTWIVVLAAGMPTEDGLEWQVTQLEGGAAEPLPRHVGGSLGASVDVAGVHSAVYTDASTRASPHQSHRTGGEVESFVEVGETVAQGKGKGKRNGKRAKENRRKLAQRLKKKGAKAKEKTEKGAAKTTKLKEKEKGVKKFAKKAKLNAGEEVRGKKKEQVQKLKKEASK